MKKVEFQDGYLMLENGLFTAVGATAHKYYHKLNAIKQKYGKVSDGIVEDCFIQYAKVSELI